MRAARLATPDHVPCASLTGASTSRASMCVHRAVRAPLAVSGLTSGLEPLISTHDGTRATRPSPCGEAIKGMDRDVSAHIIHTVIRNPLKLTKSRSASGTLHRHAARGVNRESSYRTYLKPNDNESPTDVRNIDFNNVLMDAIMSCKINIMQTVETDTCASGRIHIRATGTERSRRSSCCVARGRSFGAGWSSASRAVARRF